MRFLVGLLIIFAIYYTGVFMVKITGIVFPPAVLGLILFTVLLSSGIIRESLIKETSEFFLKNMSLLFVPFVVGLVAYKDILSKNMLCIFLVILISTTLTIVSVGLFCEFGLKFLRIQKIKKKKGLKHD